MQPATPFLITADITQEPVDFPANPAIKYSYPLDIFQKHAIAAIHKDANVLVTAKTGSGKTLVGEYAIAYQLRKAARIFYTTPIKSLSNQKFHDLNQLFPGQVGIMTGDIKYKPDASIIVMTTEILRNLLYKDGTATASLGLSASLTLDGLGAVIFDEVHYINDRSRGKVWEETMILLPAAVQLILLSATIDRPDLFAAWLGQLKHTPIYLIPTSHRVVPLTHYIFSAGGLKVIMDAKEEFHADTYRDWLKGAAADKKAYDDFKARVRNKNALGEKGGLKNKVAQPASFQHRLNELVTYLYEKELTPALFFVFSRKDCEKFARHITGSLIDPSDAAQVKHLLAYHFRDADKRAQIEKLPSYWQLHDLLLRGIAYHHSGMLPALKEVVELIFGKGLIRTLFATETFAVGINMPTKTVVFTSYEKYSDECEGHRILNTDEYIQMAGRAGRRGKDTQGVVVYLPHREPATTDEVKGMMKGRRAQVESRMDFHYDFILKTAQKEDLSWVTLMKDSYWWKQVTRQREQIQSELLSVRSKQVALDPVFQERWELEEKVGQLVNAKKKAAQRQLQTWLDEHDGVSWELGWKKFLAQKEMAREAHLLEEDLERIDSLAVDIVEPAFQFLEAHGFLDSSRKLTRKGVLATEINEGHNILFAEAFEGGFCSELDALEQVGFFAAFLEDDRGDDAGVAEPAISLKLKAVLEKTGKLAQTYAASERVASPPGFWKLGGKSWIDPLMRWAAGASLEEVCTEYGCYEGNLIRAILKIGNMLEEWRSLATFTGNLDELRRLEGLVIVRDIALPDSIYLHL